MKLDFISAQGETLNLINNQYAHLINVDGFTAAASNISSVVIGGVDGDTVNNIQAQPRGIVIDLRIKSGVNVEDAKRAITTVVKYKQKASLVWEQNNKVRRIEGVVEAIEMPRFSNAVGMQISLHCEQPFWEDIDYAVQQINQFINLHYFTANGQMLYFPQYGRPLGAYNVLRTRHFHNGGDVAVGMEIEILAHKTVINPIIYDTYGKFFGVGYGTGIKQVTMQAGDIIRITTHAGNKTVKMNGTSIMGRIKPLSTWLQLQAGNNTFSINSDDQENDNVTFSLIYKQRYV